MTPEERSGSLSSEGFPHPYLEGELSFKIDNVQFETPEPIPEESVRFRNTDRRVSLVAASGWTEALITGTVDIPEHVFNVTLPVDEREDPDVKLTLAARCSQTILRMGEVGTTSSISIKSSGEYKISAKLPFTEIRGDVLLKPYLLRKRGQDHDKDYATELGDRLANDEAWVVRVDQPDENGSFLHPRIEPFDRYPTFPDDEHLHYLYFENPSTPKLYLNANHGQLIDVLFNEGSSGANPRFRDVLFDYIEQSVWQELLVRAANDADPNTGETRHPWQQEAIDEFAEHLYNEDDNPQDVAAKMGTDASSGEDLDRLIHEIEVAVQTEIKHPVAALKLFQEGLHND